jgi:hypothetical protein
VSASAGLRLLGSSSRLLVGVPRHKGPSPAATPKSSPC